MPLPAAADTWNQGEAQASGQSGGSASLSAWAALQGQTAWCRGRQPARPRRDVWKHRGHLMPPSTHGSRKDVLSSGSCGSGGVACSGPEAPGWVVAIAEATGGKGRRTVH